MRCHIIGVDPGGKRDVAGCGIAELWGTPADDDVDFTSDDVTPFEAFRTIYYQIQNDHHPTLVAAERFTITQQSARRTRQNEAIELIGALRHLCACHEIPFLVQGASDAQRSGNRDVLRALGWWVPGKDHRNKAASQVVHALMLTRPRDLERLIGPGTVI